MALVGAEKAYLQARSGIGRSGAIRSNYVFPLLGVVTVGGRDITDSIRYGSLRITMALNEEPDTCSFDVDLTDAAVEAVLLVGADVVIGLGGPAENALFGGRILTAQTTKRLGGMPSVRSVMCADYLQVWDAEYLVTYGWPAQSATVTIRDLVARFANKAGGGLVVSSAGVEAGLPNHQYFAVANERVSTVLRRLVTMFPAGGGFYVDPLQVLHVWAGVSEPGVSNPSQISLLNPMVKAFAETVDGSQQRDAVLVEGLRTTAPLGTPGPEPPNDPAFLLSMPVVDASILDKITDVLPRREIRVGSQRMAARYAEGAWSVAAGIAQTTNVTVKLPFPVGDVAYIAVESVEFLRGRLYPWVRIDDQIIRITAFSPIGTPSPWLQVSGAGFGRLIGEVKAGSAVTAMDSLVDIVTTGRFDAPGSPEQMRAQPIDAEVVMTVRSALAESSVHEQIVQDGRFSRAGAGARGAREVSDFKLPLVAIQFESDDLNAKPGRLQAYSLIDPVVADMVGQYMILSAELSWPVWGQAPRRSCVAAEVHAANVIDAWLVDQR